MTDRTIFAVTAFKYCYEIACAIAMNMVRSRIRFTEGRARNIEIKRFVNVRLSSALDVRDYYFVFERKYRTYPRTAHRAYVRFDRTLRFFFATASLLPTLVLNRKKQNDRPPIIEVVSSLKRNA